MEDIEYSDLSQLARLHISKNEATIWIVAVIGSVIWGYIQGTAEYWEDTSVAPLINSMNVVSFAITLGIPIFLAAGLFFARPYSRAYLLDLADEGKSTRKVLFQRFSELFVLLSIYSIFMVLITFIEPIIRSLRFNSPITLTHFLLLPVALVSTIIVVTLLSAIGVLLTLGTDSTLVSTVIGTGVVVILAMLTGWSVLGMGNTASQAIALLSPHNLVRGLAAYLSGFSFESYRQMVMYLGFAISVGPLILTLIVFSLLSFLSLVVSIKVLKGNMNRWPYLVDIIQERTIWERTPHEQGAITLKQHIRKSTIQKGITVFCVCIVLSLLMVGGNTTTNALTSEVTHAHYRSSDSGDELVLGGWFILEITTVSSSVGLEIEIYYDVDIISWMASPEPVRFQHGLLTITQSSFESMTEVEQISLCSESENRTRVQMHGISRSVNVGSTSSSFLLVLRYIAVEEYTEDAHALVDITVFQHIA